MAVRRVDTLGCHPLVLMQKLAAIGGLEIIKEETHLSTFLRGESEYLKPYRIVAKIPGVEGMYIEAHDPLIEAEKNTGDYPEIWANAYFNSSKGLFRMEAKEEDKSLNPTSNNSDICVHLPKHDTFGKVAVSLLFAPCNPTGKSHYWGQKVWQQVSYDGRGAWYAQPTQSDVIFTEDIPGVSVNITAGDYPVLEVTAPSYEKPNFSFLVAGATPEVIWPWWEKGVMPKTPGNPDYAHGVSFRQRTNPIVVAGVRVRFSSGIGVDKELTLPSDWGHVPISASVMSTDSGLFFFNGEGSFSSLVGVSFIDTSSGNNYGEGRCIGIYENYPKTFALAPSAPRERILIGGTTANPGGTVVMQPFAPNPPIPVDSVSGGPVVTDLFAYNSEEIRGSVEGLLAARENLPVGSVGWLDGKRYRVHLPGRMLQIG